MKKTMKTIAQQLGITNFPFTINDSNGNEIYYENSKGHWIKRQFDSKGNVIYEEASDWYWIKSEYDSKGNRIYYENSKGWRKCEYDSKGTHIYYEDSDGAIIDNRNVPEEKSKEESPEETLNRLMKDNVVLEASKQYGCAGLTRDVMYIVLNGSIMTDEYYSELMDVINVINKHNYIHFTVTIEYPYFHEF